jgi:hypothetical protein
MHAFMLATRSELAYFSMTLTYDHKFFMTSVMTEVEMGKECVNTC